MSADADSLRYVYGETLGASQTKTADSATGVVFDLDSGRYLVRYRSVVTAAVIWAQQGVIDMLPAIAKGDPSTPFDVGSVETFGHMFITQVKRVAVSIGEADQVKSRSRLAFITDAGTADIVVTKISQGRG